MSCPSCCCLRRPSAGLQPAGASSRWVSSQPLLTETAWASVVRQRGCPFTDAMPARACLLQSSTADSAAKGMR